MKRSAAPVMLIMALLFSGAEPARCGAQQPSSAMPSSNQPPMTVPSQAQPGRSTAPSTALPGSVPSVAPLQPPGEGAMPSATALAPGLGTCP